MLHAAHVLRDLEAAPLKMKCIAIHPFKLKILTFKSKIHIAACNIWQYNYVHQRVRSVEFMNTLLEKKKNGQVSCGTFTQLKTTAAVEAIGTTGLDYVLIDSEHATMTTEFIAEAITAADAAGITPIVRINSITRDAVLHPLDAGAKGLIVPAIETPEQVRQLVKYAKFTPVGSRGYAPTRDGRWNLNELTPDGIAAYMKHQNQDTLLLPQCETLGCLEHLDEIVSMDGVDGIFVGPLDLSIAMGMPLKLDDPRMQDTILHILQTCKKYGKFSTIYCNDAKSAKKYAAMGFDSVTIGLDLFCLANAYRDIVAEMHN